MAIVRAALPEPATPARAAAGAPDRRSWGIRATLLALVATGTVPGLLLGGYLLYDDYLTQRQSLVDRSMAHTKAIVAALDRDLASIESNLRILATAPALTSQGPEEMPGFYARAKAALPQQNITNYVMVTPDGRQVLNTLLPWGAPLPANGAPADLMRIFEVDRPILSDVFLGPVTGRPLVAMGVPVHREGRIHAMLGVGILPERLRDLMTRENLPPQWIAVILDGKGVIVARTHEMERFVGHPAADALVQQASANREGHFQTTTLEGIPVNTTFARSSVSAWTVAIGVPRRILLGEMQRSFGLLLAGALALLAAGTLLAWRVGNRIVDSIGHLIPLALELGAGRTVNVPPRGLRETDAVAEALHTASGMLQRAQYAAHHDALTGLANRSLLALLIEKQALACLRSGSSFAVLAIDLDGFKPVNDTHGHAVGDLLLQEVASRLTRAVRGADIPARLGGDEFVVMLGDSDLKGAHTLAEVILKSLGEPYWIDGRELRIGASIGIAAYPESTIDHFRILEEADRALYAAKHRGRNRVETTESCAPLSSPGTGTT